VMTTNAGAQRISRNSMGFTKQDHTLDDTEEIQKIFSPEFRNRLDAIIRFSSLSEEVLTRVVDKELLQVEQQLADKGVTLSVDPSARKWLAKHGYEPLMGARPLARLIQEEIKRGLADELLFGKLKDGGLVHIKAVDDKLEFDISETRDKEMISI
jgi:ATP-dependent Clp protease ATP-binding subunit ClpA